MSVTGICLLYTSNQDWPEEATSLTIRVNPPLWLTWWAKLIYILVSISTVSYTHLCQAVGRETGTLTQAVDVG